MNRHYEKCENDVSVQHISWVGNDNKINIYATTELSGKKYAFICIISFKHWHSHWWIEYVNYLDQQTRTVVNVSNSWLLILLIARPTRKCTVTILFTSTEMEHSDTRKRIFVIFVLKNYILTAHFLVDTLSQ